jgi:predicted esterase
MTQMTRNTVILYCWLVLTSGVPQHASAVNVADFVDFSFRSANNQVLLPGRLYIPPESQLPSAGPRPLMIFLAGSGANGTNNLAQLNQVTDLMMQEAKDRGAFLYVPQTTSTWSSQVVTDEVMTMINRAIGTLNADTNRVYLTGYSLGSYGTWTMLSRYDGRFAAAIPLSGGTVASDFVASRLIDMPIFTLHSRDDPTASVSATRSVLNSILTAAHEPLPTYLAGNYPATFVMSNATIPFHTEFRELVHEGENSIDFLLANPKLDLLYYEPQLGGHSTLSAFNSPVLYDWLFAHTLAVPEPSVLSILLIALGMFAAEMRPQRKNGG